MPFPRVCSFCHKEFMVDKRTRGKYCSRRCSADAQSSPVGESQIRVCAKCRQGFPATDAYFTKDSSRFGGIGSYCTSCQAKHHKEWVKRNTEHVRSAAKARYLIEAEKVKERSTQRYYRNSGEIRARKKQHYQANIDYERAKNKRWCLDHPDKIVLRGQQRRAHKAALSATFTVADWESCLDYWHHCCAYCGRPRGLWHTLAQDHYVPLSKGGPYTAQNIIPACHGTGGCNNEKHNRDAAEWLTEKFGKRKAKTILAKIEIYFRWVVDHIATASEDDTGSLSA